VGRGNRLPLEQGDDRSRVRKQETLFRAGWEPTILPTSRCRDEGTGTGRITAGDRPLGGITRQRLAPRILSDTHHVAATSSTTYGSTNPAARYKLENLTNNGPLRKRLAKPYFVVDFHLLSFASLSWRSRLSDHCRSQRTAGVGALQIQLRPMAQIDSLSVDE
jgi:hypothetical protein